MLLNLVGIPLATAAGRALGGKKDNQAIIWDEIATVPVVFLLVPLTSWRIALAGFVLHRLFDITQAAAGTAARTTAGRIGRDGRRLDGEHLRCAVL